MVLEPLESEAQHRLLQWEWGGRLLLTPTSTWIHSSARWGKALATLALLPITHYCSALHMGRLLFSEKDMMCLRVDESPGWGKCLEARPCVESPAASVFFLATASDRCGGSSEKEWTPYSWLYAWHLGTCGAAGAPSVALSVEAAAREGGEAASVLRALVHEDFFWVQTRFS